MKKYICTVVITFMIRYKVIRMLASNREQLSKICLMIGSVPCVGSVKMNSNPMKNNFGL